MPFDRHLLFAVAAVREGVPIEQLVPHLDGPIEQLADRLRAAGLLDAEREARTHSVVDSLSMRAPLAETAEGNGGVEALFENLPFATWTSGLDGLEGETAAVTAEHPGRYVFSEHAQIAAGGAGRILRVFDAHLGREVALKELLPGKGSTVRDSSSETASMLRFLREARVTGQLEHPSIVPVYELGRRADGTLYYTMKLVRGQTLSDALSGRRTLDRRIRLLDHFEDACAAVAYAHSRGVVHRDLKPSNIMVGEFGETVVLDWGLAKLQGEKDAGAAERRKAELARPVEVLADARAGHTVAGWALGTPGYMSPEQARGDVEAMDERTDVWGLGAVLYEILAGRPPHTLDDPETLLERMSEARFPPVTEAAPDAPRELLAICGKALAADPAARYPTARELVAEVVAFRSGGWVRAYRYGPAEIALRFATRHRIPILAGTVAALLLAIAAMQVQNRARLAVCDGAERHLAGTWDDERRGAVRAALIASGTPEAEPIWSSLDARLAAYAAEWVDSHEEACAATRIRGEQSEEMLDRRMACLESRRVALGALAQALAEVDAGSVARAAASPDDLPSLDLCADARVLAAHPLPPKDAGEAERRAGIEASVARSAALWALGKSEEALAMAESAAEEAESSGDPVPASHALGLLGLLEMKRGDWDRAEVHLRRAQLLAESTGEDAFRAQVLDRRMYLAGHIRGQPRLALALADEEGAIVERLGSPASLRIPWLIGKATATRSAGRIEEAAALYEETLTWWDAHPGEDTEREVVAAISASELRFELGDYDRARAAIERAMDRIRSAPEAFDAHTVAVIEFNYGALEFADRDDARARAYFESSGAAFLELLGPSHVNVGSVDLALAWIEARAGRPEAAIALCERGLAVMESSPIGNPSFLAESYESAAFVLLEAGHADRALELAERAIEQSELALDTAGVTAEERTRSLPRGLLVAGRALSVLDPAAAVPTLTEGLSRCATALCRPEQRAEAEFALAKALAASDGSEEDVRAHAEAALAIWASRPVWKEPAEAVGAWLEGR